MKLYVLYVLIISLVSFQGCSWFVSPKEQPVIEDKVGVPFVKGYRVGTLATTAERRVVIVNLDNGKFCAEPPADAAENLVSSFAAAIEGTDGPLSGKAELANAFASNIKQLFQRSQGVQLYRDGMYSLCQAFLNGSIGPKQFVLKQSELLESATKLIEAEIPHLPYLGGKAEEASESDPAATGDASTGNNS